jgi:hypothetical protein
LLAAMIIWPSAALAASQLDDLAAFEAQAPAQAGVFTPKHLEGSYALIGCQHDGDDLSNVARPAGASELPGTGMAITVTADGSIAYAETTKDTAAIQPLFENIDAPKAETRDDSPHMEHAKRSTSVKTYSFQSGVAQEVRVDERFALVYQIYWDHVRTELRVEGNELAAEQNRDYGFRFPLDGKTRRFKSRQVCRFRRN